jgi:hypothetical protein
VKVPLGGQGGMVLLSTDVNATVGDGIWERLVARLQTGWQRRRKVGVVDRAILEQLATAGLAIGWSVGPTFLLTCQTSAISRGRWLVADSRISVRLDKNIQRRLDEEVEATGKRESEVVRAALAAYLDGRPGLQNCLDLARRHRLIGCVKGLPPDLSTNREHFEGFGR